MIRKRKKPTHRERWSASGRIRMPRNVARFAVLNCRRIKAERMRTLIYKRTHTGDPDKQGRFGLRDCMGQVRSILFEAVIGIGGDSREPVLTGIANKLTWIGIGPHVKNVGICGPVVMFDRFILWDSEGQDFRHLAPVLAKRFYTHPAPRFLVNDLSDIERKEVEKILKMAKDAPPSAGKPVCKLETDGMPKQNCRRTC
jgi:hypothetical protein